MRVRNFFGESYQCKANVRHLIFRNPDRTAPLKFLIAYTVNAGQPYLIIPYRLERQPIAHWTPNLSVKLP
jgi:hypothetical protein